MCLWKNHRAGGKVAVFSSYVREGCSTKAHETSYNELVASGSSSRTCRKATVEPQREQKTGWPPQETGRSAGTLCFTIRLRQPSKGTNTCSTMLAWRTGKVSCPMGPMERLVPRPAAVWSRASSCCASWPTSSHRLSWRRASWPTSSRSFSSQRASSCCHPRLSSQLFSS